MTVELWSFSSALGVEPGELRGMSVEARDGGIGRIVDVVERVGGAHLVIDTGPLIFGRNVMLPAGVITAVDRDDQCVFIDRAKDEVRNAPEHDPEAAEDLAQRDALSAHYGGATTSVAPTTPFTTEPPSPPITAPAWPREDEPAGDSPVSDTTAGLAPEGIGTTDVEPAGDRPSSGSGEAPRDDVSAERRFARDADSSAGTEAPAARKSTGGVPIGRYDSLTAAEVIARLPSLSQRELAEVERYEKRHESRRTVLTRIDSLREKEPWRGYDDEKVDEIRKKLADADDERAKRVRDYERRHRDRKGVMAAARRAVASA